MDSFDANYNFNFGMVLNHNLASMNAETYPMGFNVTGYTDTGAFIIGDSGKIYEADIRNCPYSMNCWHDGFSALKLPNANYGNEGFSAMFQARNNNPDIPDWHVQEGGFPDPEIMQLEIGSILWGKYFEFPQNCDLNTTLQYDYGTKTKENIAGKSISTGKWNKVDSWYNDSTGGTAPFGLRWPSPPEDLDTTYAYNSYYNVFSRHWLHKKQKSKIL